MEKRKEIPDIIVGRLPRYLRVLINLKETKVTTNSHELGLLLGYSAAQVRKDLSQFDGFGKQGTGYNIESLINNLEDILNVKVPRGIVLVGIGNLGKAILHYKGFEKHGFYIAGAFDDDPDLEGVLIGNCKVKSQKMLRSFIQENNIQIAMITTPASEAQKVAEELVTSGISAILSYATTILKLPEEIRVEYSDPIISLQHMTYYLD
jgi:redox-sensing transcriptional repressor